MSKQTFTVKIDDKDITVKRRLSFEEMVSLVNSVSASCFDDEDDYIPAIRSMIFKAYVINTYTNYFEVIPNSGIDTALSNKSENDDGKDKEGGKEDLDVIDSNKFYEIVLDAWDKLEFDELAGIELDSEQFMDICNAISEKIKYKLDSNRKECAELISRIESYADYMDNLISVVDTGNVADFMKTIQDVLKENSGMLNGDSKTKLKS